MPIHRHEELYFISKWDKLGLVTIVLINLASEFVKNITVEFLDCSGVGKTLKDVAILIESSIESMWYF